MEKIISVVFPTLNEKEKQFAEKQKPKGSETLLDVQFQLRVKKLLDEISAKIKDAYLGEEKVEIMLPDAREYRVMERDMIIRFSVFDGGGGTTEKARYIFPKDTYWKVHLEEVCDIARSIFLQNRPTGLLLEVKIIE